MSRKNKSSSSSLLKKHPVGVVCLLLSLILVAAIMYRRSELPAVNAQLEAKSAQGSRLKANISHSAQLSEQYDALVAANAKVGARLVRASELAKNQQFFYRLEAETGTKYNDLRPPPSGTGLKGSMTNYVTVPYTLSVEGGYPQLLMYLRRLENGSPYVRFLSASMNRANNDITNTQLVLNLSLELLGQP